MKKSKLVYLFGVFLFIASFGGCISFSEKNNIVEFDYDRDAKQVLKIFYDDYDWLFPGPDYLPEYIIEHRTPGIDQHYAKYFGKLNIKVLRRDGRVAGFAAYYKKNFYEGWVQFIAVARDFRRKGFGRKLTIYAVNSLFDEYSCKKVTIYTRLDNKKARSLYKSLGFKEVERDTDGFGITYSVNKKSFKG